MLRTTHSNQDFYCHNVLCKTFPFQPLLLHPFSLSFSCRLPARNIKAGVKSITALLNSRPFVPQNLIHGLKGPRALPQHLSVLPDIKELVCPPRFI